MSASVRQVSGLFLLFMLVAVWCGDSLWGGSSWLVGDLLHHHLPWRAWMGAQWAQGSVPLWAPVGLGHPLMADGQAGALYPVDVLLFALLPPVLALNWTVALHTLWAGLGAATLARASGRSPSAMTLAGLSYAFGGMLVSHLVYLPFFQGMSWAPWMLASALWALRADRAWWGVCGLFTAACWLCGHPQAALYATIATLIVALWEGLMPLDPQLAQVQPRLSRRALAQGLGIWGLVAVVVAAPQLWLTASLLPETARAGGLELAAAGLGSLPPEELLNGVFPALLGLEGPGEMPVTYGLRAGDYVGRGVSYVDICFYLGLSVVALALCAGRGRRTWMWWALVAAGLLLALGAYSPWFGLLHALPGWSWFRFPARATLWVALAVPQLAALGMDRLGGWLLTSPLRVRRRALLMELGAVALFGGALAGSALIGQLRPQLQTALAQRLERSEGTFQGGAARGAEAAELRATEVIDAVDAALSPTGVPLLLPVSVLLLLGVVLRLGARRRISSRLHHTLVTGVVTLDLWSFGAGFIEREPAGLEHRPPSAVPALGVPGPFRTAVLGRRGPSSLDHLLLPANLGLLWGLEDVVVPSPLRRLRSDALVARAGLDLSPEAAPSRALGPARGLLDLFGVRFLFSRAPLRLPGVVPRWQGDGVWVYENLRALPRAFVVGCTRQVDPADAIELTAGIEPRELALVEGPGLAECTPGSVGTVSLTMPRSNVWELEVELSAPGWLVLTEAYAPGQRWQRDGVEVTALRTDGAFSGVPLPVGHSQLRMRYLPSGLLASLVASLLMLGTSLRWIGWRLRGAEPTAGESR